VLLLGDHVARRIRRRRAGQLRLVGVERHSAYHGSIQAGIVCFATDREAAAAIIDRLLVTET
jgi:hypothetical protein